MDGPLEGFYNQAPQLEHNLWAQLLVATYGDAMATSLAKGPERKKRKMVSERFDALVPAALPSCVKCINCHTFQYKLFGYVASDDAMASR
ncbi:unnamed protein product [Pieris brassicae]|uniref:Uncharacterized protein n=1 Tax=Pieris brassicae TaxID=7116 RepID=A0A9P0TFE8_PIEBR|nr:unnamed protein product [Pieris brassicae]